MHCLADRLSHCDDLESYYIYLSTANRGKIICQAQPLALVLSWKVEAGYCFERASWLLHPHRIIHNKFIAAGLAGKIAINDLWLQVALLACLEQHAFQARAKIHLYQPRKVGSVRFPTPVQAEKRVQVHTGRHVLDADALKHARPPEWWPGNGKRGLYTGRGSIFSCLRCRRASRTCRLFQTLLERLFFNPLNKCRALLRTAGQAINYLQPFKGVAGIKYTVLVRHRRRIRCLLIDKEDPPPIGAINGCSSHNHREVQSSFVQFLHAKRHLFGCTHQQRREADGIGVDLDGLVQNRIQRHLFAQVIDRIAVIAQDRVDQVFADIVYIAKDRCQHNLAFRIAFYFLQVTFQVCHGPFHHFRGLQHKGQDQFARAETISHIFHRWQQHRVEHVHRGLALSNAHLPRAFFDDFADQRLDALLAAVQDLPVDALRQVHTLRRINFVFPIFFLGGVFLKVGDVAWQGIVPVVDQVFGQLPLFSIDFCVGCNVQWVDDGQVQTCFHSVIEEHAVEYCPRVRLQAKRNIAYSKYGQHTGKFSPGPCNGVQRLDGRRFQFLLSRCDWKREYIEDKRVGRQSVLLNTDIIDFVGNLNLAFSGLTHTYLVNGQRDHSGTMFNRHGHNVVYAFSPRLHIDRVDDGPSWIGF